jgi:hypothetical protein
VIGGEIPLLTSDQVRRASDTWSFSTNQLGGVLPGKADLSPPPSPRWEALGKIRTLARDDTRDLAMSKVHLLEEPWEHYTVQRDFIQDLGKKLDALDLSDPNPEEWAEADRELGKKLLQDLWKEPTSQWQSSRERRREYLEQFRQLLWGAR